jgi:uncharacterized protein YwgA
MIDRELIPLALLNAKEGQEIEGRTRLQKMVFLIQQETEDASESLPGTYNYVPYDYGPFARDLYDDLDRLKDKGVIVEEQEEMADGIIKYNYRLGPNAESYFENHPQSKIQEVQTRAEDVKKKFNNKSLAELIDLVYSKYPEYAKNSVL